MDKYLKAIASEEEKLSILNNKKTKLITVNKNKKEVVDKYNYEEKKLNEEQNNNLLRKTFLEHKREYLKDYLVSAFKFGIKSSLIFLTTVGLLFLLDLKLGSNLEMDIASIIPGNSIITVMLGCVEYYNVSRSYRYLVNGYHGNIDEDIEEVKQKINSIKKDKAKVQTEIKENEEILRDLDLVINEIKSKILEYRKDRNNLIESLISELDNHIEGFEYQESDINKVLKKQIH